MKTYYFTLRRNRSVVLKQEISLADYRAWRRKLLSPYRCTKCHRIYLRKSGRRWIKSWCTHTEKNARLYALRGGERD